MSPLEITSFVAGVLELPGTAPINVLAPASVETTAELALVVIAAGPLPPEVDLGTFN